MVAEKSFIDRIHAKFSELSKGQKVLAEFFLAGHPEIAFWSSEDIAQRVGTSRSSLVRFAQALGYEGYTDLQQDVQRYMRTKLTPSKALHGSLETFKQDADGSYAALKHSLEIDIEALRQVEDMISADDFAKVIDVIVESKEVFIFGLGVSTALADFLTFRFRRYSFRVHSLTKGGSELFDRMLLFNSDGCLVTFGFHRYPKELSIVLEHARKTGMPSILITDDPIGPYHDLADYTLAARRGPLGIMHSLVVPMAILNALVLAIGQRPDCDALESLERLDKLRDTYGYS